MTAVLIKHKPSAALPLEDCVSEAAVGSQNQAVGLILQNGKTAKNKSVNLTLQNGMIGPGSNMVLKTLIILVVTGKKGNPKSQNLTL